MGIPGLLDLLKPITNRVHVSQFRGNRIAVDAHCWLHRGAYSCSRELATNCSTTKFISFFMNRINLLRSNGIEDITIVIDGQMLSNKSTTCSGRRELRQKYLTEAHDALVAGNDELANSLFQRSINISPQMINQLIDSLKVNNIKYIIAPYEADAQIAFLSIHKMIDLAISEDSDLLVYGCKQVLYKLDKDGNGDLIKRRELGHDTLPFTNWSNQQFLTLCCLTGCDYSTKVKGIGIKTALKIVKKNKTLSKIIDFLQRNHSDIFNSESAVQLRKAVMTFQHQVVYNPKNMILQHLAPLPNYSTLDSNGAIQDSFTDLSFLGELIDNFNPSKDLLTTDELKQTTVTDLSVTNASVYMVPTVVGSRLNRMDQGCDLPNNTQNESKDDETQPKRKNLGINWAVGEKERFVSHTGLTERKVERQKRWDNLERKVKRKREESGKSGFSIKGKFRPMESFRSALVSADFETMTRKRFSSGLVENMETNSTMEDFNDYLHRGDYLSPSNKPLTTGTVLPTPISEFNQDTLEKENNDIFPTTSINRCQQMLTLANTFIDEKEEEGRTEGKEENEWDSNWEPCEGWVNPCPLTKPVDPEDQKRNYLIKNISLEREIRNPSNILPGLHGVDQGECQQGLQLFKKNEKYEESFDLFHYETMGQVERDNFIFIDNFNSSSDYSFDPFYDDNCHGSMTEYHPNNYIKTQSSQPKTHGILPYSFKADNYDPTFEVLGRDCPERNVYNNPVHHPYLGSGVSSELGFSQSLRSQPVNKGIIPRNNY